MGVINETIDKIKELTKITNGVLLGMQSNCSYDNEDDITRKMINHRLSGQFSNFSFKFSETNNHPVFTFSLSEFPNCCGKGIIHGITISKTIYSSKSSFDLKENEYDELVSLVLELAEKILKLGSYSSFDFIISDHDNTMIYNALKRMNIKPTASWRNSRYAASHNCNNYTVSMLKTEDVDYLDKSKLVRVV